MKEVNFRDRVPTYPGRVILKPVTGQANTYDMVRADAPTNPGTPLDKATFDSVIHSRLTGRYYTPVLLRVADTSRAGLTASPLPTAGWVYDTANDRRATFGGYVVEVSSDNGNGTEAAEVFDGSGWQSVGGLESWVSFYHAQALVVRKMSFAVSMQYSSRLINLQIQGSSNGTIWSTLYSVSSLTTGTVQNYEMEFTGEYNYYRLLFTSDGSNRITVSDFRYTLYDIPTYVNQYTESQGFPTEWTLGQRVTIATPGNVNTFAVTSNTLNGLPLYTILQPSKMYELIYADGGFAAKEV